MLLHKSYILGKPVCKHDLKKKFQVKLGGRDISILFHPYLPSSLFCYHFSTCPRVLEEFGCDGAQAHCRALCGYISGSVPRWMEEGKLLCAATRNGQREELSGCWRLRCPESMSQHFAGA